MKINRYFNTPSPIMPEESSVICVGVNFSAKENSKPVLRFIIKRDSNVKIESFTLIYRFSKLPLTENDPDNPFFQFVCKKEDIDNQDYIILRGNYQEDDIPQGCTAVVATVTLENGELLTYKPDTFIEPAHQVVTEDRTTVSPMLEVFFRYRSAIKNGNNQKTSVNSLITKAASILSEENAGTVAILLKKKRINRRFIKSFAVVMGVLILLITVIAVRNINRPVISPLEVAANELLGDGRYADAYKIVLDQNDDVILQKVCKVAAEHYQHIKDYKTAYLYACAAPEPFDTEIIDTFINILINQSRQEEAYRFLTTLPQYTDAMQSVCVSAVDAFLERKEFDKAYFYAVNAPESLEEYVMQQSSDQIMGEGELSDIFLDSLGQTDDPEKFDEMASWAAESLRKSSSYKEAASVALRINNAEKRSAVLEQICISGMSELVASDDLISAIALYNECVSNMREDAERNVNINVLAYAKEINNAAGILYFSAVLSENTDDLTVLRDDQSIKRNGIVWKYMTAEQKRDYHARALDIYKEVYRIEDGTIEGITDAVSVAASEHMAIVLLNNGTVKALSNNGKNTVLALPDDSDIVSLDVGKTHAAFLHTDGTVTVVGNTEKGQGNTGSWTDVVKIAAGSYFTAALRADGTLYACGSNASGQCNVEGISGVVDIAACDNTLVLHMADNTLRLVGDISMGLKSAAEFTDITRVRAGGNTILAETARGTYVMAHASFNASAGLVLTWEDMKDFAAGLLCVAGIDKNNVFRVTGDGTPIIQDGYEPGVQ